MISIPQLPRDANPAGPWCANCRTALEDVSVVQEPIEERCHGGVVAEGLPQSSTGLFDRQDR